MDTTTATKPPDTAPLPGTAPLATVDDTPKPNPFAPIIWNQERVDLVKRQICPKGITDDELAVFLMQCKRTELDPLIKEAFCVPRRQNLAKRNEPENWITRHEFQPAEAGMAARADRFPDFRGIKCAAVYEKDDFTIDADAGTVVHKFSPNKDRGRLVGAWARVFREGRVTPIEWVRLSEFSQATTQWAKAETMIVKCARAAAWRRAYPNTFGGLYVEEEMTNNEERDVTPAGNGMASTPSTSTPAGQTRTQSVTEKAKAAAAAVKPNDKAPPAGQQTVDGQTVDAAAAAAAKKRRLAMGELTLGPSKGKLPSELSADELTNAISYHEGRLKEHPMAQWAAKAHAELDDLNKEQKNRLAAADREPGSDDGANNDPNSPPF